MMWEGLDWGERRSCHVIEWDGYADDGRTVLRAREQKYDTSGHGEFWQSGGCRRSETIGVGLVRSG